MKNVLVVTYYWPPAGGIEVQRTVKFCKYLREFGWNPIVLTVKDGNFSSKNNSFTHEVSDITTYHAPSWEPHSLYNTITGQNSKKKPSTVKKQSSGKSRIKTIAEYIRLNLFIPDSRIGWYPNAVKLGSEIIAKHKPELIFSSCPPYTVHLIARQLKNKFNLPWIADFRDPWMENVVYNTVPRLGLVKKINASMEARTVNQADRVVTIGPVLAELLKSKMDSPHPVEIIPNGYDTTDLQPNNKEQTETFYLSYFGTLYWHRIPHALFESIRHLIGNNQQFAESFKFRFVGNADAKTLSYLNEVLPEKNIEIRAYVEKKAFSEMLSEPQVLLLTIDNVPLNELIVTGKIFDYITTGNPVLGIGPLAGDAAKVLEDTSAGQMCDYQDTESISKFISDSFSSWQHGELQAALNHFPQYERRNLTSKLAGIMNSLTESSN